jgi:ankyrin repeat protein
MINTAQYYKQQTLEELEHIFIDICQTESIEDIEYLLTSCELKENVDINYCNGVGLELATGFGNVEVVKFLLDNPKLKKHALIENNDYEAVHQAIKYSYLEIVKYLLEHHSIKEISYDDGMNMIIIASEYEELEIFSYLVGYFQEKNSLNHEFNKQVYDEDIFNNLFRLNKLNFIENWVFSYDIEKTDRIDNFLIIQNKYCDNHELETKIQLVHNIFEKRELNKNLLNGLSSNSKKENKIKI